MRKRPVVRRKPNVAALPPLPPPRIPVEETNLTEVERAKLADPDWVTEDEADAIMAEREFLKSGGKSYGLEEVLRENGIELVRTPAGRRAQAVSRTRRRRSA